VFDIEIGCVVVVLVVVLVVVVVKITSDVSGLLASINTIVLEEFKEGIELTDISTGSLITGGTCDV
jgi:hypothetical protein